MQSQFQHVSYIVKIFALRFSQKIWNVTNYKNPIEDISQVLSRSFHKSSSGRTNLDASKIKLSFPFNFQKLNEILQVHPKKRVGSWLIFMEENSVIHVCAILA
jgi:hypothetical protein